ncbi:hypothetical protein [Sinorhizobium sp. RAC02]|uniref:hypothetical protein n=1 Tax=Sinorhizobium sp. RAC02 TaxID=1842534 RepID=UPI00083E3322|nr:hypothetical protein [Sinorhizobium sp. RAC02]AOF89660.1 hypothetical protein BSY16_3 [Sinorhizobium sp. RAC02]
MAQTYAELRQTPTEDLIKQYDNTAKFTSPGLQFLRDEISRRESEAQNQRMLDFTKHVRDMTIAITVMTAIVLILTVINISLVW